MGYSEFGGGGSVLWHVRHGGTGSGPHGRDPKPEASAGGTFSIFVNGKLLRQLPIDFTNPRQIQIVWDPQTPAELARLQKLAQRDRLLMAAAERPAAGSRKARKTSR